MTKTVSAALAFLALTSLSTAAFAVTNVAPKPPITKPAPAPKGGVHNPPAAPLGTPKAAANGAKSGAKPMGTAESSNTPPKTPAQGISPLPKESKATRDAHRAELKAANQAVRDAAKQTGKPLPPVLTPAEVRARAQARRLEIKRHEVRH